MCVLTVLASDIGRGIDSFCLGLLMPAAVIVTPYLPTCMWKTL